jgi:phage terminase large subunit-like protein
MRKKTKTKIKHCACGCGRVIENGKRFIHGHHFRGRKHSLKTKGILREKRINDLRAKEEANHPHRLAFPKKKRGEQDGDYRYRKFEYFCLHYVTHIAGKYAGKPVILMKWQREILKKVFGTLDSECKRKYRRLFIHIGRKNGKTFLTCLIILYWLTEESFRDPTAEIVSCANTREQSIKTIFKTCRLMVNYSRELTQLIKIGIVPPHLTNLLTNGSYEPLSADARPQLGKNLSLVVFDETHGQPNSELWDAMSTSQSMRDESLFVSISTAGDSRASFYYTIYERAKEILSNPDLDPTTLVIIYEVAEELDWRDPKNFLLANPAIGDEGNEGFRPVNELNLALKEAIEGEGEGGFRQYYLNQWAQHGQRTLIRLDQWDACAIEDFDIPDPKERRIVGGLDLSSTTDLTGLAIIIEPSNGSKIWVCMTWAWLAGETLSECSKRDRLPYEKWVGKEIIFFEGKPTIQIEPVLQMLAKVKSVFPKFRKLGYDPYLSALLKPIEPYFELLPVAQQYSFLSPALKTLKSKILEKKLQHNGDPLLRSMVENARVLTDPSGNIRLDKSKSTSRIDGLVALNIAASVALQEEFRR